MKKFLVSASLIFVLIVGVIASYVFNVDAQKTVENTPVIETTVEDNTTEEEPTVTENTVVNTEEFGAVDLVFGNNSWETISKVFKAGAAEEYWNLGDVKEITLSDGFTYGVQIVDMHKGRYAYSDGTGSSNGVLQFVECLATGRRMNTESTDEGGYTESAMRSQLNTTVFNQLPEDLRDLISEVQVLSGVGNDDLTEVTASDNKLFLASEYEISGMTFYSVGEVEGLPQFGYWALHKTDADRIKTVINSSANILWWLRSARPGVPKGFAIVYKTGIIGAYDANVLNGVCPCFAF